MQPGAATRRAGTAGTADGEGCPPRASCPTGRPCRDLQVSFFFFDRDLFFLGSALGFALAAGTAALPVAGRACPFGRSCENRQGLKVHSPLDQLIQGVLLLLEPPALPALRGVEPRDPALGALSCVQPHVAPLSHVPDFQYL